MKMVFFFTVIIGLSSIFLFYVWGKVDVVRVGYELEQLSKRKIFLEQEHDRLQITFSQLTAPDRLAREASTQLNMKPPGPGQVILVSNDGLRPQRDEHNPEPLRVAQGNVTWGSH